ncbi:MAG: hypothetical protein ABF285_13405, partial [Pacificibacter sp.]
GLRRVVCNPIPRGRAISQVPQDRIQTPFGKIGAGCRSEIRQKTATKQTFPAPFVSFQSKALPQNESFCN